MSKVDIAKSVKLQRRKGRVRAKVSGTAERPRLSVHRSLKHITAQLIDDVQGKTVVSVKDTEVKVEKTKEQPRVAKAHAVGKLLAERATKAGVSKAVFDRAGRQYHGRIKAVAEGAREGGLEF